MLQQQPLSIYLASYYVATSATSARAGRFFCAEEMRYACRL